MTIGEKVREQRKAAGLTMAELGKRIGVTAAAISRYELGQRELTIDTLQSIADALDIHIFDIVGIGDKMKKLRFEYADIVPLPGKEAEFTPEKKAKLERLLSKGTAALYDEISDDQKREFWEMLIDGGGAPKFKLNSDRERLNSILEQMNDEGYTKVADYAEDILPRYRREDAPEPAPSAEAPQTPSEPPPAPPEGPQKPK